MRHGQVNTPSLATKADRILTDRRHRRSNKKARLMNKLCATILVLLSGACDGGAHSVGAVYDAGGADTRAPTGAFGAAGGAGRVAGGGAAGYASLPALPAGGAAGFQCPILLSCNWCSGAPVVDNQGCTIGWQCANGVDPCATPTCDGDMPCSVGSECRADGLCWPTSRMPAVAGSGGISTSSAGDASTKAGGDSGASYGSGAASLGGTAGQSALAGRAGLGGASGGDGGWSGGGTSTLGVTTFTGAKGGSAQCPGPPSCNWCSGHMLVDNSGCVTGWQCANGADPCTTPPCSDTVLCDQGKECRADRLCWSN